MKTKRNKDWIFVLYPYHLNFIIINRVMPTEIGNEMSLEEKRRSLKHVPEPDEDPLLAFAESGVSNSFQFNFDFIYIEF